VGAVGLSLTQETTQSFLAGEWDGASGGSNFLIDEVSVSTSTAGTNSTTALILGAATAAAADPLNVAAYEHIIISKVPTAGELTELHAYLAAIAA
jgi:hypothetical protein